MAGFIAALCCAGRAAADPASGQPFRLEYWAKGNCPDAVEFARQVQTRAPRLRPAVADEPALGFYAELEERAGSATGRLTARSPDGREVLREVRGPTCADVATALALIAALAADPSQSADAVKPLAKAAPPPRSKPKPKHSDSDAPLPPIETGSQPGDETFSEVDPSERWTYGVGAALHFDSSIAPSPGYGLGVAFEAEEPGGSFARWLLSVSAIRAAASNTEVPGGGASFTWVGLRTAACPLRLPRLTPLFFRPCAFLDAAVLSGEVTLGAGGSKSQTTGWFATGGFGRIEALVGEAASFQLDVGATVPLTRPTFRVTGGPDAFTVPSTGILGRIGLSYRFQ